MLTFFLCACREVKWLDFAVVRECVVQFENPFHDQVAGFSNRNPR